LYDSIETLEKGPAKVSIEEFKFIKERVNAIQKITKYACARMSYQTHLNGGGFRIEDLEEEGDPKKS
jgi:hypothetical protein